MTPFATPLPGLSGPGAAPQIKQPEVSEADGSPSDFQKMLDEAVTSAKPVSTENKPETSSETARAANEESRSNETPEEDVQGGVAAEAEGQTRRTVTRRHRETSSRHAKTEARLSSGTFFAGQAEGGGEGAVELNGAPMSEAEAKAAAQMAGKQAQGFALPASPNATAQQASKGPVNFSELMSASIGEDVDNNLLSGLRQASTGAAAAKSGVTMKGALSAASPSFGEELAQRVGRPILISRPGAPDQMRLTLDPKDLGTLNLKFQMDEEGRLNLMINTDNENAKDLLNRHMNQLREALAKQNIAFGDVQVQVDDGSGQPEWEWAGGEGGDSEEGSPGGGHAKSGLDEVTEQVLGGIPHVVDDGSALNVFA
ncbi:MAG: flagellar hook-length control protein FliK [Magnetococcales bacterium]|nr:flagellar hook-length control protein FliK [Magnetococcales bacterium]